ncbi:MAG: hypothetical protein JW888_02625 [Pirellulales bacterium]|nr:hypothetical protein [Pirellulales bacterium]
MSGSLVIVVSYLLLAVFIAAFVVRTVRMAKQPVHLRWELSPVPHEKGKGSYGGSYLEEFEWWTKPREKSLPAELIYMFLEIVFLKSLWEHNRRLWWFSFPLHFGLYLLIVMAAVLLVSTLLGLVGVPVSDYAWLREGVLAFAALGYLLGGFGAIGLLASRLSDSRLKGFTSAATLLNLALLLAMFASGGFAIVASDYFAGMLSDLTALFTAGQSTAPFDVVTVHLGFVFLFLAYLPFSQMMHFVAKYFTYHNVRWDDAPLVPGSRLERKIQRLLNQPVTWSASHLKTDGKKNWVDLATEDVPTKETPK